MPDIGALPPDEMRIVWSTIQTLQKMGFVLQSGNKSPAMPPPNPPISVKNVSGETIPAFACMQCTDTTESGGKNYIEVDQPADSDGSAGWFLFNGAREIGTTSKDQFGVAFAGPLVRTKSDVASPAAGDTFAPQASSWSVASNDNGFLVAAGADDIGSSVIRAFLKGGGGSENDTATVIADVQVNGTDLEKKTITVQVPKDEVAGAWTDWHTGTECDGG